MRTTMALLLMLQAQDNSRMEHYPPKTTVAKPAPACVVDAAGLRRSLLRVKRRLADGKVTDKKNTFNGALRGALSDVWYNELIDGILANVRCEEAK